MTKKQLYAIAINDHLELEVRYKAARELQRRRFPQDKLLDLVRLYPVYTIAEIAERLDVPHTVINGMATKLGLNKGATG